VGVGVRSCSVSLGCCVSRRQAAHPLLVIRPLFRPVFHPLSRPFWAQAHVGPVAFDPTVKDNRVATERDAVVVAWWEGVCCVTMSQDE
jgi:hypothetical protein